MNHILPASCHLCAEDKKIYVESSVVVEERRQQYGLPLVYSFN